MTRWRGFTDRLQTPEDLLAKMEHDFERMRSRPDDAYAAFDFFVAAEHIVDWRYPDDPRKRKSVRSHDPAKTVSHLASGAKHFEATAPHHQSVANFARENHFGRAAWNFGRWGEAMWDFPRGKPALVITASNGRRYGALQFALLVFAFWRTELGIDGSAGIHESPQQRKPED